MKPKGFDVISINGGLIDSQRTLNRVPGVSKAAFRIILTFAGIVIESIELRLKAWSGSSFNPFPICMCFNLLCVMLLSLYTYHSPSLLENE